MDNDRLDALFAEAAAIAPAQRAAWLDAHCADDPALRRELERLLAADAIADGVLERAPELLATTLADTDALPERFGIWRVTGRLGAGGMGEVWLAERDDGEFKQRAAIKQVAWPTPGLMQRFRTERQILAGLEHPGIARLIDGGVDAQGCPWLAMEYVEGVRITEWVQRRALGVRATVELVLRVCAAVQFAHARLVVHSDIKPSNILVGADGRPKLLDFGIARVLAPADGDAERTRTAAQLMTPDYAAPELLAGGAATTAVDVYALGVLLYELLAGSKPYRLAVLAHGERHGIAGVTIRPPSAALLPDAPHRAARRRALRGDLDRIVHTALAPEPTRRYASVEALATDLGNWLAERPINARGPGRWYRARKFIGRHRAGFAATVAVFAVLAGATLYSRHQANVAREQAARADAVRNFVVGVFEQTDPDSRAGKPITATELLDLGERQVSQQPASQPFRTEMQGLLGYLHWQIGDYTRGEALMREATGHPAAAAPPVVRAQNLLYLAQVELQTNDFPAARRHASAARAMALRAGGAGALIASEARFVDANAMALQHHAARAEKILLGALKEDTRAFGAQSDRVAEDLGILAVACNVQGRHADAIAYVDRAIVVSTALHGRASGAVLGNLQTRAMAELGAGDRARADRDMAEAAAIAGKLYGPAAFTTLSMRANLYVFYASNERYAQALTGHLDLIRLTEGLKDAPAGQLGYEWYGAATDYLGLGRYVDAERAARQALAHMPNSDPDYYIRVYARAALAESLLMQGRLNEAEAGYADVLRSETRGRSDALAWSIALAHLGDVYRLQHRYAEAVAATGRALAALPPNGGATPQLANLQMMAAAAQLDAGNLADAKSLAARATLTADIAFKGLPIALSVFEYLGARVALAEHRPADAETLLRAAIAARKDLPADDPRRLEVEVGLIRALEMQNRRGSEPQALRAQVAPLLAASHSPYVADLRQSLDAH